MELRNFSMDIPGKGTIDVDFTLHFNNNTVSISEIKVHSDFESGLPHHPQLTFHDNAWQLHVLQPVMKNNEIVIIDEYLNDSFSKEIVKRLLEFKNEAKVK
jgi:hypothetical protein